MDQQHDLAFSAVEIMREGAFYTIALASFSIGVVRISVVRPGAMLP
ncbi:MAG TPA: hypothetical protein VKP66_16830 [Steroidobacteraceae bacterium]|nr:hypothetical protein [Steroidobacteraceae bacterium]